MIIANLISYILVILGAINWGLVGIFDFNLVEWIFMGRTVGAIVVYVIIAVAAIWLIFSPLFSGKGLRLCRDCDYKE